MPTVAVLRIAPVKALATVTPARVTIAAAGVAEDRRLFLVDEDGAVVTQRAHPQLVKVVPDLDLQARTLTVRLPDGGSATASLERLDGQVATSLFGKARAGRVVPGDVAAALSDLVGQPVRLVLADRVGTGWDEGPVSLLSRSSAAAVGAPAGDTARFRMLIEIAGTGAHEEETWVGRDLALGTAKLRVAHPLERCVVITKDPATGESDWDGLRALAEARGRDHLCLGVIATVSTPGEVAVGDAISLLN